MGCCFVFATFDIFSLRELVDFPRFTKSWWELCLSSADQKHPDFFFCEYPFLPLSRHCLRCATCPPIPFFHAIKLESLWFLWWIWMVWCEIGWHELARYCEQRELCYYISRVVYVLFPFYGNIKTLSLVCAMLGLKFRHFSLTQSPWFAFFFLRMDFSIRRIECGWK